jgi:hypothetical protein
MFTEPLAGWRKVDIRQSKTMIDWAQEIRTLLDIDYQQAEKVILICDNLNTHKVASLYEAFLPQEAMGYKDIVAGHILLQKQVKQKGDLDYLQVFDIDGEQLWFIDDCSHLTCLPCWPIAMSVAACC